MTATLSTTLSPDAVVPAREDLLDPAVFAAAVAAETALHVAGCARLRARYQVGKSLRVLHEVEADGVRVLVSARSFQGDVDRIARKAREQAVGTRAPLPGVIPLRELGAVAWVYPNDRKLTRLPDLPAMVATLLARARVEVHLVAWAPEKSATVRCDGDDAPLAYAKAYAEPAAFREREFHDELRARLRNSEAASIPRALAWERNLLVLEPARGTALAAIRSSTAVAAYARYGRALAELHSVAPAAGAQPFVRLGRDHLLSAATVISRARPDVAEDALALAHRLVERRPPPLGWACLHGDAHPKNALDDGNRITFIDLEQVAAGDPAAELGSVLAVLAYRFVTGDLAEEAAASRERAFLDAYAQSRHVPPAEAIAWNTAAALLAERALRAVTRVRAEGLRDLPELIRHARATLTGDAP